MKITLSRNQWEFIGQKTGWKKTANYGDKTDYNKIDIYVDGKYKASTNWAKTCKEAKEKFLEKNPDVDANTVKCEFADKKQTKKAQVDQDIQDMVVEGDEIPDAEWNKEVEQANKELEAEKDAAKKAEYEAKKDIQYYVTIYEMNDNEDINAKVVESIPVIGLEAGEKLQEAKEDQYADNINIQVYLEDETEKGTMAS